MLGHSEGFLYVHYVKKHGAAEYRGG